VPFRDIVGHRHIVRLLARAASQQSLPPSLIFGGPEGVGKRLAAVSLAQALNCGAPVAFEAAAEAERHNREESGAGLPPSHEASADRRSFRGGRQARPIVDACGACTSCRRIARGVHSDVLLLEPDEGSIKVDAVRDMLERTQYRPFEGRRRVVIIDPADALVESSQQALLKTLEEPPPGSVFVLITPRPDALLATVRSRCPRLRFQPLSPGDAAKVRRDDEDEELIEARDAAQRALEALAGARDPRRRLDVAKLLAGSGGGSARNDREDTARRLRAMASLVRDLGVLTTRADERLLANADLQRELGALAAAYGRDRILRAFSAVDRALSALTRNASPKVVADWLALQV
jgi:DNA polymerase-3 subunit delta'